MQLLEQHRFFRLLLLLAILTGCASSTVINSEPQGAQVFVDDTQVGTTPYTYSDRKTIGSTTHITLKKEGYEEFQALLVRNEEFDAGACAGGVFTLLPFLWIQKYSPDRTFELTSMGGDEIIEDVPEPTPVPTATPVPEPVKPNAKAAKKTTKAPLKKKAKPAPKAEAAPKTK